MFSCNLLIARDHWELWDVTGFHPDLPYIRNIQVGTTATAYDHSNGATYILVLVQSLLFGGKLDN